MAVVQLEVVRQQSSSSWWSISAVIQLKVVIDTAVRHKVVIDTAVIKLMVVSHSA